MNSLVIILIAMVVLVAGYVFYGRWLAKKWGIDEKAKTPAFTHEDGEDFVPSSKFTVFSHQFSSIAGAGPVTGPILASVFGWVPVLLWLLIGGLFFGADYAMAQKISPLSFNDHTLLSIGIKKALPETEEQALVYLYMASSQLAPEKYTELLNEFISQYPNSADGYLRRANNQIFQSKEASSMDKVAADMDKALEVAQKKDDAYFNRAKLIYGYQLDKPEKTYKDWTYDRALDEVRKAIAIEALPVYIQLEGDIQFAKKDYAAALASYEKVNDSNIASPATFFSAAKTKELMEAAPEEVLALMDSCMARFVQPYSEEAAPYLLERAQMRLNAGQGRGAMLDYDEYYKAVRGNVNDVFYYYREQAAVQAKQFQRALDDLAKAIELNPKELEGVDTGILDPRDTYADASEWDVKAKDLAERFIKNFAKYEGNEAGKALVAAGPQL